MQTLTLSRDAILDANRRFHDEVEAERYDERMGVRHDANATAELVSELGRALGAPLPHGGTVVDLGSGTGHVAIKLARTGRFARVIAVDISARMLARAAQAAEEAGVVLETRVSDLETLPFDDASVDLVVGCAVLHHLPAPDEVVQELHRVLRPGGRFVFVGEPSRAGHRAAETVKLPAILAARALRALTGRERRFHSEHIDVHTFDADELAHMARGFDDVRVSAEGFVANAIDQGLLVLLERLAPGAATARAVERARVTTRAFDRAVSDRLVPRGWRSSLKVAGRRPR